MEPEIIEALEKVGVDQDDKPNQSETIRRIIKEWLVGHGYLKE
ncbi:hypothetical protein [Oricola indica]